MFIIEEEEASVTIELKRLSNFLGHEQLNPQKVVCGIETIHLAVYLLRY